VAHLIANPNFEIIRHDLVHPILLEVDRIYNFACPASPGHYQYNPVKTVKTSVMGAINMLGLAKRVRARILQASTSEVYGDPLEHPQRESYWGNVNPIGPRSVYDEAKRFAEAITMAYRRYRKVETRIARIFNTYGPRMRLDDGRVVPTLVAQALRGQPLTLFGDGSQTRSFCYVSDNVEGIWRLLRSPHDQPINIGNPNEMSIRAFADAVQRHIGSTCPIVFQPLPEDDPKIRRPDISRARTLLGWEPKVDFEDGMRRTVTWFRERVAAKG
jgi:nucleoside-diphosphate-sugar epimerase